MLLTALRTQRRLTARLLAFVVGLLLLAQSLGLVHRIGHGTQPPARAGVVVVSAADTDDAFGDHSVNECRLFDQLASADLATVLESALALPAAGSDRPVTVAPGALCARLRAYLARGPPPSLA